MNNFEYLKSLSLEDFAAWLDKNGQFDGSPWMSWFDNNYCKNCPAIECKIDDSRFNYKDAILCAYCELENKCKYFKDFEEVPDNKKIIELWLHNKIKEDL